MKPTTNTPQSVPDVFTINGKNLVQIQSAPKSGYFKFKDVEDGEIYIFEKDEIPSHYWDKLNYGLSGLFGYEPTPQSVQEDKVMKNGEQYTDGKQVVTVNHSAGSLIPEGWVKVNPQLELQETKISQDYHNQINKILKENEALKEANKELVAQFDLLAKYSVPPPKKDVFDRAMYYKAKNHFIAKENAKN